MVKLIKKEVNSRRVVYYYQPEGKADVGVISYYFNNEPGNRLFCDLMSSVESESYTTYRDHAIETLLGFIKENNYPTEEIVKWY